MSLDNRKKDIQETIIAPSISEIPISILMDKNLVLSPKKQLDEGTIINKKIEEKTLSHRKIKIQDTKLNLMSTKKNKTNKSLRNEKQGVSQQIGKKTHHESPAKGTTKIVKSIKTISTQSSKTTISDPETKKIEPIHADPKERNSLKSELTTINNHQSYNTTMIDETQLENLMNVLNGMIYQDKDKDPEKQKDSKNINDEDEKQKKLKGKIKKTKSINETSVSTSDKLQKMKGIIESFLKQEADKLAKTVAQQEQLAVTDGHVSEADLINSVIDNHIEHEKRHEKRQNFDGTYLETYDNITKNHNIQVKITKRFVKDFLKDIIQDIFVNNNEKFPKYINLKELINNIVTSLPKSMSQDEFYSYTSEYLIVKSSYHYFYDLMAARIATKRLHNITTDNLLTTAMLLQENLDKNGDKSPILSDEVFDIITRNHTKLQSAINYDRDYQFDYFGIKTLERSYLYKLHFTKFKIIERPQHMFMRVALGIHGQDIESAIETYDLLSMMYCTHATPTLFNAGTRRAQMSSCFLQAIDDSIESIFDSIRDIAFTSKWAGGIGVHLSGLRCRGSLIRGTNGLASGIIPLCVLLNKLAKYINQGGKRNGSIACYLEPHHPDIFEFCDLRKNTGNDDNRARDLYLGLWISDLFLKRVKEDGVWSLMCPDECPGLNQVHGNEYVRLYEKYEVEKRYVKQVKARELFLHILIAQSETGFPYMLYKDHANAKSNQKNLGTIRSSNLCAEIIEYSDNEETAVCFTADTNILTKDGIRKIVDCNEKEVLAYFDDDINLSHKEHFEKAKLINNGKKTIFELRTNGNMPIKATENHPFLVRDIRTNELTWKKVSELKEKTHRLITPSIEPLPGFARAPRKIDEFDEEWFLKGYDIGSNIVFTNHDKNKIDNNIINEEPIKIANFLAGIFYCHTDLNCQPKKISLTKTSENPEILYSIQTLLLPFGIKSSIKNIGDNCYSLIISGTKYIERFSQAIGLSFALTNEYYEHIEKNPNDSFDNDNDNLDESEIETIKKLGEETVYDLSLSSSHNFIANGYVVHNCNLASICLPKFVEINKDGKMTFNYVKLMEVCRILVRNLDKVIERNYYPTEKTKRSNLRHRPMGIGVQGLADVYNIMGFAFSSKEAYELNKRIFESIYYACIDESKELAKRFGTYPTFKGSPASQGLLQFHLWGKTEEQLLMGFDWKKLVEEVKKYGLRNSLLTALMPTASTSQIMGNSECIEPYMSNIFKRSTLAGEFIVVNKNLMKELLKLNLWDDDMRMRLIIENGSIQNILQIPEEIRKVYETAFEIKQMHIVNQSADRGEFVDQSQSMNIFMAKPNFDILTAVIFGGHARGLKTGMYYYRSLPAVNPINFGIDVKDIKRLTGKDTTITMISESYSLSGSSASDKDIKEKEQKKLKIDQIGESDIKIKKIKKKSKDDIEKEASIPIAITTTNSSSSGMCKWKPGVRLDDCESCGS